MVSGMCDRGGMDGLGVTKKWYITLAGQMCDSGGTDGLWVAKNGNPGRPAVR